MVMAFSGKARSGKSTSAHALKSLDERCVVLSFAQELKRMVMEQFPEVTAEHIARKSDIVTLGGKPIHVRQLLIEFGSMYRRICPDFWVMKLWRSAVPHLNNGGIILIDDLRYKNEANFLTKMGAHLIRVNRPGVELINDPSETELDDWEFKDTIINGRGVDIDKYRHSVKERFGHLIKTEAVTRQRSDYSQYPSAPLNPGGLGFIDSKRMYPQSDRCGHNLPRAG